MPPTPPADYQHYATLLTGEPTRLWEAATVAWVHGLDEQEVARRLDGDLATATRCTVAEAIEECDRHYRPLRPGDPGEMRCVAVVGRSGDWVLVVEPNGFRSTQREVLGALSRDGGRVLTVYWNENADNELVYADDGRILAALDMIMYPEEGVMGEDDPHALDPYLAGLPFGAEPDSNQWAAGLTVGERVSGVRLDADWVAARHLRVIVPE